ncbi:MAG: 3-phosphoshikimate 1-carboxyvinyltransferase [Ruminococcaceae bacterium]|nr:3-phosphoshikimate 1-carboxyvinyltransferase [Oscillospiraceae bacterium]
MTVLIEKGTAAGRVKAPPSKSMAHRYLICGAFSGKSLIKGIELSQDIKATLECLSSLGAEIKMSGGNIEIGGIDFKNLKSNVLFCNESGSTLRFLLPVCLLFDKEITLKGSERLFSRSLSVYKELCESQGIYFSETTTGVTVKGKLQSGKYSVRGDISSQFISGLIFALSCLQGESTIEITGDIESGSYLSLTIKALADFGVRVSRIDERTIFIKGGIAYKNREISVEGDYSNAAFLEAFNYLGGNVVVKGLKADSLQGDRVYKRIFDLLESGTPTVDVSDCPDLAPILITMAAIKNGAVFTGTKRLKIKESDRGAAMSSELSKFGCSVLVEENRITVEKREIKKPRTVLLGHNDHRIVMSLAVISTLTGGEILGAEAVSKSFPDFFEKLKTLGIDIKVKK